MTTHLLTIACIAAGGAIGAVGRYLVGLAAVGLFGRSLPLGTLAVNVLGCFLMGFAAHLGLRSETLSPVTRAAFGVGFLGALTTFSAFGNETLVHLQKGDWPIASGNVLANVALGLLAVWGGQALARAIVG